MAVKVFQRTDRAADNASFGVKGVFDDDRPALLQRVERHAEDLR